MLGKNIAIRGIFITILLITMGVSQVSIEIKNVDTNAGTLDIYMTNAAGCSYCEHPDYNKNTNDWLVAKGDCENLDNTTWVSYDSNLDSEACAAVPSLDGNGGWWFDGEVGGFQFEIVDPAIYEVTQSDGVTPGIGYYTITDASGGSAEALDFNTESVGEMVIGFTFSGATIPVGTDELLTTLTLDISSGPMTNVCFGDDIGTIGKNIISGNNEDNSSLYVAANWGGCFCGADADEDDICDLVDNCVDTPNSNQLDTDGDSANCSGANEDGVLLDPQPETQAGCTVAEGTWNIIDGGGDECDDWYYDANNDQDGDGIAECTLSLAECNNITDVQNDNCPTGATDAGTGADNQTDTDGDGLGDACDACINDSNNDEDGDGVCYCTLLDCSAVTNIDNCSEDSNPDQGNSDDDTLGDACDNCSEITNENQANSDSDTLGDACDNCSAVTNEDQANSDDDTQGDVCDNCSAVTNEDQVDADFDFVGDACDVCADYDDSYDADSDGVPDGCDACPLDVENDADADGVCGDVDNCPSIGNPGQEDSDEDGVGDACPLAINVVDSNIPAEFSILQNFPNPFNPVTSIIFDVAEMDEVSLVVYDLTGKEVVTLVSGTYTPGTYSVEWNAVNNAGDGMVSGMYIYRYISSEKAITRKMLYLK